MVFSAEFFGAELVAVVVGEDAIVGSVVDEQPAISRATHVASPAMRTGLGLPCTWDTAIASTAVSVM